jgi:glutathione S-transferase
MIGQPYTKVGCIAAESRFRPRNKLPVANVCGVMLDDSTKIIEAIQKHAAGTKKDLDAGLDEEQRAIAKLVGNTLSQSLFWSMLYNKFNTHRGRDVFRRQLSDLKIFAPLRPVISALAFNQMHAQLIGQGIARYPRVQVIERALEDIAALSQILGSKPFILGDRPSSMDALLYAMLVLVFEDHELQADLSSTKDMYPNLAAYVERMKKRYVPELDLSNTTNTDS